MSTTANPSPPDNEEIGKWYADLHANLSNRLENAEKEIVNIKNDILKTEQENQKVVRDNLIEGIKVKKLIWWILLLSPFVLFLVLIVAFNLGGNSDKIVDSIKNIIYGLGVLGLVEMLYVGYKNYTMDDRIKSLEERYNEIIKKAKLK